MKTNTPVSDESRASTATATLSRRLIALDAARGIAVIGMFIQHFALNEFNSTLASGNPTLLFLLCGGISYMLMSQNRAAAGATKQVFRRHMLARAVFIDVLGYTLILLSTPFGVILPAYAVLFILALVLVHRSTRTLLWVTAALLFIAPLVSVAGGAYLAKAAILADIAGGPLSAAALAPAFVAGMAIGRFSLSRARTGAILVAGGAGAVAVGASLGALVLPQLSSSFETWLVSVLPPSPSMPDQFAAWPLNTVTPQWHMLLWSAPHSASTVQTLTGLGVAALVLGLAILCATRASILLRPFAAVGRVPLTLYALQFVVIWVTTLLGVPDVLKGVPASDLIVTLVVIGIGALFTLASSGPMEWCMRKFDAYFTADKRPAVGARGGGDGTVQRAE